MDELIFIQCGAKNHFIYKGHYMIGVIHYKTYPHRHYVFIRMNPYLVLLNKDQLKIEEYMTELYAKQQ